MNYIKLETENVISGDGLRVVLWLSGCSHHCKNCQNPQTWDKKSGILFDENAKTELFEELSKDYISGITLTGGDPLYDENINDVLDLVNEIRLLFPNKSIWLYTGYDFDYIKTESMKDTYDKIDNYYINGIKDYSLTSNELRWDIIRQCDILVDGRYIHELRDLNLKFRGSSNQRLIDVKKTLLNDNNIVLYG